MEYHSLKSQIGKLLILGRENAGRAVNSILVQTYWHIEKHIVEFEQGGNKKSEYGSSVLNRLSADLGLEYGKGFGRSNLFCMTKLYLAFGNSGTLSYKLMWSHYFEVFRHYIFGEQEIE